MASVSSDELVELVRKSRLLTEDELAVGESEFRERHGEALDFLQFLRGQGLLTAWQAEKLAHRKYKGFFLGNYKLLDRLGAGGMGRVYLAEHTSLRRRAAIKVLPHSRTKDRSLVSRFQLEARALAKLDHKNVIKIYDVDRVGGLHYIVMEFVAGRDLESLVTEQGPLSATRAAHFIAQAAAGLAHVHSRDLIHRDIKPSNLLLDRANVIKLLDLGLARLADDDGCLTQELSERALGTTDYISPEQAVDSHGVDARTDIYSLGCTFYFLLTGHPPFNQGSIPARLLAHQTRQPPAISEERLRVSAVPVDEVLISVCGRMMAKSTSDRYQNAKEVFDDLSAWLDARRRALQQRQTAVETGNGGRSSQVSTVPHVDSNQSALSDSSFAEDLLAGDTFVSQSLTPTTPNRVAQGQPAKDRWRSASGLGREPLRTAAATTPSAFQQFVWAWVAAGGTAVLMMIGFLLFLSLTDSDNSPAELEARQQPVVSEAMP